MIRLRACPQAKKKFTDLREYTEARWLSKKINAKPRQIITSMTDIFDLYNHRREIELGFRAMKQSLLKSQFTLRSNQPKLIKKCYEEYY